MGTNRRRARPPKRRGATREHPKRRSGVDGLDSLDLENQPLIAMLREALRSPDRWAFPTAVGALLVVTEDPVGDTDPGADPVDSAARGTFSRGDLIESFLGVDIAETTAALHVLAPLLEDEFTAARIRRTLQTRRQPVPAMLRELGDVVPTEAMVATHPLGDGDNVGIGLRHPDGSHSTFMVYVDHNLGTVVKDAFAVDRSLPQIVDQMLDIGADDGMTVAPIDLAAVRARLVPAIDLGGAVDVPWAGDTWPGCRPLLNLVVVKMPGDVPEQELPSPEDDPHSALVEAFLGSEHGAGLDPDPLGDDAVLVKFLAGFATFVTGGDPMRWSPTNVEILLTDWFVENVFLDDEVARGLPAVLRAFIRYCHQERGLATRWTIETLQAVDRWEPEFLADLEDPDNARHRQQGREVVSMVADPTGYLLGMLAEHVGGLDALEDLDATPLPDEPLDLTGVPEDLHDLVRQIAGLLDGCADALFDTEFRTACRRFLARAARGGPGVFRRRAKASNTAAAVAWLIGKANDLVATAGGVPAGELTRHFGVAGHNSARAQALLAAYGAGPQPSSAGSVLLADPSCLTSEFRAELVRHRDVLSGLVDEDWPFGPDGVFDDGLFDGSGPYSLSSALEPAEDAPTLFDHPSLRRRPPRLTTDDS